MIQELVCTGTLQAQKRNDSAMQNEKEEGVSAQNPRLGFKERRARGHPLLSLSGIRSQWRRKDFLKMILPEQVKRELRKKTMKPGKKKRVIPERTENGQLG